MYQKRTEANFANPEIFYNFHVLHFSVGHDLMIASPSGKKSKVYVRFKVRGFDGNSRSFTLLHSMHRSWMHLPTEGVDEEENDDRGGKGARQVNWRQGVDPLLGRRFNTCRSFISRAEIDAALTQLFSSSVLVLVCLQNWARKKDTTSWISTRYGCKAHQERLVNTVSKNASEVKLDNIYLSDYFVRSLRFLSCVRVLADKERAVMFLHSPWTVIDDRCEDRKKKH
jgi:hypothetical protein